MLTFVEFYLLLESPPVRKVSKTLILAFWKHFLNVLKPTVLGRKIIFHVPSILFWNKNFWLWYKQYISSFPDFHIFSYISFSPLCGGTDTVKGSKMRMSSNNNVFPVTFDNRNWKWSKVITQTFIKSRFLYTMEERLREFKILGKICVSGIRKWRKVGDSSSLYSIIIFNGGK